MNESTPLPLWLEITYSSVLIVLLFLSYIFSGSEAAFFSLPPSSSFRRKRLSSTLKKAYTFLEKPDLLLSTILLGNTAVNAFASSIFAVLVFPTLRGLNLPNWLLTIVDILGFTLILLIVGEITPKLKAIYSPEDFIEKSFPIIQILIKPLSLLAAPLSKLSAIFDLRQTGTYGKVLFDEIHDLLIRFPDRQNLIDKEKLFFFESLRFLQGKLKDFVIPRNEIPNIQLKPSGIPVEEVIQTMRAMNTDFVVVTGNSLDDVRGVITVDALFKHIDKIQKIDDSVLSLDDFRPYFLIESQDIKKLWDEKYAEKERFNLKHRKVALLIDEFGNTIGAICLTRLYQGFFGSDKEIQRLTENEIVVDGDINLGKVAMIFGVNLEDDMTVAAFILKKYYEELSEKPEISEKMEKISKGFKLEVNGLLFEILEIENGWIKKVRITRIRKEKRQANT